MNYKRCSPQIFIHLLLVKTSLPQQVAQLVIIWLSRMVSTGETMEQRELVFTYSKAINRFADQCSLRSCPHSSIKTTKCSAAKSFDLLKKNCNFKGSCKITPTNGVFGDPCYGTYKYVKLDFYCKPVKRAFVTSQCLILIAALSISPCIKCSHANCF